MSFNKFVISVLNWGGDRYVT